METIWVLTKSEGNETNKAHESRDRGRNVANEWEGNFCLNKYVGNVLQLQLPLLRLIFSVLSCYFKNNNTHLRSLLHLCHPESISLFPGLS